MHRRSLIKCILGLAAAPKVLAEMEFKPPIVAKTGMTTNLFNDLNFVVPDYMSKMIEKYGSTSWAEFSPYAFNEEFNKSQLASFEDKLQTHGNQTKNT